MSIAALFLLACLLAAAGLLALGVRAVRATLHSLPRSNDEWGW